MSKLETYFLLKKTSIGWFLFPYKTKKFKYHGDTYKSLMGLNPNQDIKNIPIKLRAIGYGRDISIEDALEIISYYAKKNRISISILDNGIIKAVVDNTEYEEEIISLKTIDSFYDLKNKILNESYKKLYITTENGRTHLYIVLRKTQVDIELIYIFKKHNHINLFESYKKISQNTSDNIRIGLNREKIYANFEADKNFNFIFSNIKQLVLEIQAVERGVSLKLSKKNLINKKPT